ncbi:MAG TPA: alpha-amylase family glycosyl hydrolase, partial [Anaerolineales bacterium]|nr:alpha-amylase family glycosyl hydrolase [Anaerolineales bacterium]
DEVKAALRQFADEFPPVTVYRRQTDLDDYLEDNTDGVPNRRIVLEEMVLLWLANMNPAFAPFLELFDDTNLKKNTAYQRIIRELHDFLDTQPPYGPDHQNLLDMLRSPAIAVPHSLSGQLEYIRQRWSSLLGKYLFRLLSSLDLIREEEKAVFLGPGPSRVYEFGGLELEEERFSPDKAWMPSLVLIAKNVYVWMDQMSKHYQQNIYQLDQIPDAELDRLARWGFTGLWLIGLWERSPASERIKQLRGNPEAVASAYSLFDYVIADDLGGDEAYRDLHDRAWRRGIRLASDMVPNHVGIDGKWVIEHPDWFISLDNSPFPSYSFNGPNLSWDDRVGIYLEDHYYDGTDAAVVFKRVDHWTGNARFIYHGNDGTSMPWNDTAQLNYLLPEVREAVIQTILHVARKFSVIRFDAAMTLAKKHFQRLWFPEPGTGGAIPTRAEHGLTKEQFDALMSVEFWREVVDRVAQEASDTLLLAEAFWLMEGYFVRTLGMHRVYNSAFMNMLRDEKNLEYRLVIKNTLEFDPEILKRYVNFMNNPDERTAADQFGKDDKYFGICTMLATMPGLPMFGHGQIEGYSEKYGMEFRRAYWDEQPDAHLVERHEREIFPLLRRRYLFAEVRNFLLYDFFSSEGFVNEDVFAYSNRAGEDRALVVYHNKYAEAHGWIRNSAAYSVKAGGDDERNLVQMNLGEGLGLHYGGEYFVIFRDHVSGLEYIRSCQQIYEQGLFVELGAYKYQVFLDFREIQDNEWHQYAQLKEYLNGRGVPSVDVALKEIFLQPVHQPFRQLINADMLTQLIEAQLQVADEHVSPELLSEVDQRSQHLLKEIKNLTQSSVGGEEIKKISAQIREKVRAILEMPVLEDRYPLPRSRKYKEALHLIYTSLGHENEENVNSNFAFATLLSWAFTHNLGKVMGADDFKERSLTWINEWLFGKMIAVTLQDLDVQESKAWQAVALIKVLIVHQDWQTLRATRNNRAFLVLQTWLQDAEVRNFLQINRYQDILWFNKESFDMLLGWMLAAAVVATLTDPDPDQGVVAKRILDYYEVIKQLQEAEEASEFQVEKLLEESKSK